MKIVHQIYCDLKLNKISHILVAKFFYRHCCLCNFNHFESATLQIIFSIRNV